MWYHTENVAWTDVCIILLNFPLIYEKCQAVPGSRDPGSLKGDGIGDYTSFN